MRVLITQTAFLGDVVILTALIRECYSTFEKPIIDVLVCPPADQLLKNNPYVENIIVFDKKKQKLKNFFRVLKTIRKKNYDLSLNAHSSFTTVLFSAMAGITERAGFDRRLSRFLLTKRIPFVEGKQRVFKNLDLLKPFGNKEMSYQTELYPTQADDETAKELMSKLDKSKQCVVLFPGSVWNTKRWLKDYYVELVKLIAVEDINILFSGSNGEYALCEEIIDLAGIDCLNLAGKCSLLETAAVIAETDAVVCNDSGALHIANAMQTDAVVFFGPTVKKLGYFPLGKKDIVLEADLDCRPCGLHGSKECPLGHHNCMKSIKPHTAFESVMKLLNKEQE